MTDSRPSPRTGTVDLRALDCVGTVDENLVCPICRSPFVQPVRLRCDHTFCRDCVRSAIQSDSRDVKSCPSCRVPTTGLETLSIPRFVGHMLDDVVVYCPNGSSGCTTTIRRGDVQYHVDNNCLEAEQACPLPECSLLVARKYQAQHCLHKSISCSACGESVLERDMETHAESVCEAITFQCVFCHDVFSQLERAEHKQSCPQAILPCKAASIGCGVTCSRADVVLHEKDCTLARLQPTMQAFESRLQKQETAMQILQNRNNIYEDGLLSMRTLLAATSSDTASTAATSGYSASISDTQATAEIPPFESATHHLLSLHESLREELDRVSIAVTELDARSNMMILNESLRVKEEMAHTNAAIASMRAHLQWLMSARLQQLQSGGVGSNSVGLSGLTNTAVTISSPSNRPGQSDRRTSDPSRQETKL